MLKIIKSFGNSLTFKNIVKDHKLIDKDNRSNNLGQNLSKSKKAINLAKLKTSKNYLKLSKFKKTILDKSEILVNLTLANHVNATQYLITKAWVVFTYLR